MRAAAAPTSASLAPVPPAPPPPVLDLMHGIIRGSGVFDHRAVHRRGRNARCAHQANTNRSITLGPMRIRISSVRLIVRACHARFDHLVPLEERGRRRHIFNASCSLPCVDQLNLK
jgi:hypothetical protein